MKELIPRYQIQGRLIERAAGKVVRDEVRNASSDSIEEATWKARAFTEAGFTTWIFEVSPGGLSPQYVLLQQTRPVQTEGHETGRSRTGPRPASARARRRSLAARP